MRACLTGVMIVLAGALGACGGDDDEQSADEKQIRATLSDALRTSNPDVCTRQFTQRFVEQIEVRRGKAAVRSCREEFDVFARSVSIENVSVSGPRAAADVHPKGGGLPFKTARIGLRKSAGRWRLDRLKSGTIDRPAFFASARKEFAKPPDALPKEMIDCVLRDVKSVEDEDLVRAFVEPDPRVLVVPAAICGVRSGLASEDAPKTVVACVSRRLRRELTTGPTGRRLAAEPSDLGFLLDSPLYERIVRRVAKSCLTGQNPADTSV